MGEEVNRRGFPVRKYKNVKICAKKPLKPGERAPRSVRYKIIDPRGGRTGQERTVVVHEPKPPTPKPGEGYILVDPSRNGAGKPQR